MSINWKFWKKQPDEKTPQEEKLDNGSKLYIVCKADSAITTHLRLRELSPLKFGGGLNINTLCGMQAAWDTKLPVLATRCRVCKRIAGMYAFGEL